MIVLSVSKTYWNRGVRSHRKGTKQIWQVYYLDDNLEKLHTKRVNWAQAMYYKSQIRRKRRVFCGACGFEGIGFYKDDKEILKDQCPECNEDATLLPGNSIEELEKVLNNIQS